MSTCNISCGECIYTISHIHTVSSEQSCATTHNQWLVNLTENGSKSRRVNTKNVACRSEQSSTRDSSSVVRDSRAWVAVRMVTPVSVSKTPDKYCLIHWMGALSPWSLVLQFMSKNSAHSSSKEGVRPGVPWQSWCVMYSNEFNQRILNQKQNQNPM